MDSLDETTLPVVDAHERLVGMIDAKDLASVVLPIARKKGKEFIGGKYPMEIYVKSLMSHAPPAVDPDASLGEIVELMLSHKLHSIVITRNELPVGIITQLDLVELIASYGKRKGVYVQITGLEEGDPDIYDAIYSIIQKSMARINKLLKPDILTVHVAQQRQKGLVARYSIHAKLVAIGRTFYGRFEAWDLLRTVSGALDHIEKQIRKRAERKKHREKLRKRVQGRTRRKRREANISLSPLF
jgi:CBS domain-containing protein